MKRVTTGEGMTIAQFKQANNIAALSIVLSAKKNYYAINKADSSYAFGIKDNCIKGQGIDENARISEWLTEDGEIVYYCAISEPMNVLFDI